MNKTDFRPRAGVLLAALLASAAGTLSAQKLTPQTVRYLERGDTTEVVSTTLRPRLTSRGKVAALDTVTTVTPVAASTDTFRAFITLTDPSAVSRLADYGVTVVLSWANYVSAIVPVSAVEKLEAADWVQNIAIGNRVKPLVDEARSAISADQVQGNDEGLLPQPYTGKGVVVGVIDTGLEYYHRSFRNSADTELRIKRVWDQNGIGAAPSGFGYGAEYTTPEAIKAARRDNTSSYHGTHVTCIAAGTKGLGMPYYGMAPESDIVFVSMGENGMDIDIVNGIQYIFNYAESVGKPCVINMSLGSHQGPHDGTSPMDRYFDSVVGKGRILVGACGNEAEGAQHASLRFTADQTTFKTTLGYPSTTPKNCAVQAVGSKNAGEDFRLRVAVVNLNKKGQIVAQSDAYTISSPSEIVKAFDYSTTGTDAYFYIYPGVDAERPSFYIESYVSKLDSNRKLAVIVEGKEGDEVHLWNLTGYDFLQPDNASSFTAGDNNYTVGEIGGVSQSVISVGSSNSRNYFPVYWDSDYYYSATSTPLPLGTVSDFSSRGPTLDGRMKPDVTAPGYVVVSAVNQYYGDNYWQGNTLEGTSPGATWRVKDKSGNYYYYSIAAGTSMASPAVAGVIAQWLEADPTLDVARLHELFAQTCKPLSGIESPSNIGGYGLIDAYAGVKQLLGTTAADHISADSDVRVWADRSASTLCLVLPTDARLTVCSASGATVADLSLTQGVHTLDASAWGRGLYLVNLRAEGASQTVKVAF